jgi:hypothetical protein
MKKLFFTLPIVLILVSCQPDPTTYEEKPIVSKNDSSKILADSLNNFSTNEEIKSAPDSLGEYSQYNISFTIETDYGKVKGYAHISALYLNRDSLKNSEYLKLALSNKNVDNTDSLTYFKNRIHYINKGCFESSLGDQNRPMYYLLDKEVIPLREIKKIEISNIFIDPNLGGILNELSLSDTIWIKNKPIRCVSLGGYLCSYKIFIYEESKIVNDVIKGARIINSKDDLLDGDDLDKKLYQEVVKIKGQKVVIVNECTC